MVHGSEEIPKILSGDPRDQNYAHAKTSPAFSSPLPALVTQMWWWVNSLIREWESSQWCQGVREVSVLHLHILTVENNGPDEAVEISKSMKS